MGTFDDHERSRWAARAEAYDRSFAPLCAHPAETLLTAAGVRAGSRLLDAGTGPGTVAALAIARGALVVAVDAEPSMLALARSRVPDADLRPATRATVRRSSRLTRSRPCPRPFRAAPVQRLVRSVPVPRLARPVPG